MSGFIILVNGDRKVCYNVVRRGRIYMWANTEREAADNGLHQAWIYQVRGLAIIAVVVCHQQYILHDSEYVQMLTLYSVTTLIFLMGYTSSLSYKKQLCSGGWNWHRYFRKLVPVLLEYTIATVIYVNLFGKREGVCTNSMIFEYLINFSAAQLFYFIQYYISLSLISPLLIYLVRKVYLIEKAGRMRWIFLLAVSSAVGAVGYYIWDTFSYLGGSYLFVYFLGVIMGYVDMRKSNIYVIGGLGIIVFSLGLYSSSIFYLNWVRGIYTPFGIDKIAPKFTLNPPNISIILYSAGVVMVSYFIFGICNAIKVNHNGARIISNLFEMLGKDSLDIYIWHIMIQNILVAHTVIDNIWLKRMVFYTAQFFIPVCGRKVYMQIKREVNSVLSDKDVKS